MAKLVFVVGDSGSGKSTAARNLDPKTTVIINSDQKDLPFKRFSTNYNSENKNYKKTSNAAEIKALLLRINEMPHVETVIIDTFTRIMTDYVMSNEFRSSNGFQKWGNLAGDIYDLINIINEKINDDIIVYAYCHPETIMTEEGKMIKRIAAQGKQLEKFAPESFSSIVFFTQVVSVPGQPSEFFFRTVNTGRDTCKTPLEMFEEELVPNDLVLINEKINEYYG
jgi:adenosyl cobinamide kinase/adenosyl cobinamide phosphate guanylyltransferase